MAGSASSPGFNPGAMGMYNQQLGLAVSDYNQILGQYGQAQNNASQQLQGIYSGYGALQHSVLNSLGVTGGGWGVAAPAAQQIERQYTQSQGQNQQQLMNSGLGNSTLAANVANQGNLQAAQAYGSLGSQLAQTAAGYQSQIGLAGLASRQQGLGQQLGLTSSLMGDISHYNFAPQIPLYGQYSQSSGGPQGGGGGYGGGQSMGAAQGQFNAWAGQGVGNAFNPGNTYGYAGAYQQPGNPYANQFNQGQTVNPGAGEYGDLPTDEQVASNDY